MIYTGTAFDGGTLFPKKQESEMKTLYKSSVNRIICGVCGGIGEYLGIDPTVVRVIWVIASLLGTIGIWAYLICALIIPNDPTVR